MTWDDALTEICTEINRVSDKYGSEAISVSTGGGGNPHFSNVKRFGEAINTPTCGSLAARNAICPVWRLPFWRMAPASPIT